MVLFHGGILYFFIYIYIYIYIWIKFYNHVVSFNIHTFNTLRSILSLVFTVFWLVGSTFLQLASMVLLCFDPLEVNFSNLPVCFFLILGFSLFFLYEFILDVEGFDIFGHFCSVIGWTSPHSNLKVILDLSGGGRSKFGCGN